MVTKKKTQKRRAKLSPAEVLKLKRRICEQISGGKSLRSICASSDMPGISKVFDWLREDPQFEQQYARAREAQADHFADEIAEIADSEPDPNKARVRIDARKWVASKLKPKAYGDRLQLDADVTVSMTDDQLDRRIAQLLGKAGAHAASGGAGASEETA